MSKVNNQIETYQYHTKDSYAFGMTLKQHLTHLQFIATVEHFNCSRKTEPSPYKRNSFHHCLQRQRLSERLSEILVQERERERAFFGILHFLFGMGRYH